jgi:hypothetical protein
MKSTTLFATAASVAFLGCSAAFTPTSGTLRYSKHNHHVSTLCPLHTTSTSLKSNSENDSFFNPSRILLDFASDLIPPELEKRIELWTGEMEGFLDRVTDGWALSFADLTPESPKTLLGQSFLLTNAAYLLAGISLTVVYNDFWLAFWTDCAAICSYNYHYTQLQCCSVSDEEKDAAKEEVRLALLLDYSAAGVSIISAMWYLLSATLTSHNLSNEEGIAIIASLAGTGCLLLSWKWEYGKPYMFWHGLWHLGSASAGYLIGVSHQQVMSSL